ncbi:hypothetical protein [Dyadobacter fermentans]|uniref:Outer membrane protein beta-barrel domain-containing protein n=1 Tax=Dyadobacter fermentans (strain ATCC 700827 / DSM 18053 / CIP 107007 / KCTC 52180 / NS114) TaxID=471854 RepID=C6VT95_DYAFD|nr:hypothetical protein [Dyadobacter fermentans]ACT96459.1 hypothetical protein Dfer_5265 [Dyadobacter fermentans DSM 18053]
MKNLVLMLFCWHIANCVHAQFNTTYKSPDVSWKIMYPIGWRVGKGIVIGYDSTSYMRDGKISREMTTRFIQIFKRSGVEEFQFIPTTDDVLTQTNIRKWIAIPKNDKYTYYENAADQSFSKPLQAFYNNPKLATKISIKTIVSNRDKLVIEEWVAGGFVENPQPLLSPKNRLQTFYTRNQLRNAFRMYKTPKVLYLEASVMPGVGGRVLQVMNRQPDISMYSDREQNEMGIFNWGVSLKVGFNVDSRNSFYLSGVLQQQGFRTQGHIINWSNGLSTGNTGRRYDFRYSGFETGYSFNPFKENTSFSSDVGLHFLFASRAFDASDFTWGSHLSIGPKFRIGGRLDLRVLPTGYFNFKRLETGSQDMELVTRLFTAGLKVAVRQYF